MQEVSSILCQSIVAKGVCSFFFSFLFFFFCSLFSCNVTQQRDRVQIYVITLLLGSMVACLCNEIFGQNWTLNRDFRFNDNARGSLPLCICSCVTHGTLSAPQTIAKTSGNHCECIFSLVLLQQGCTNGICNDERRPSMSLIPCNWGWITICSPALHKGLCSELQTCARRFEYYVYGLSRPCRSGSCCTLFSWLRFTWKRSILDFEGFLRSMLFYSKPFTIDSTLETRSLRLIVEQTRYFYSNFITSNNTWLVYFGRLGVINIAGLLALYRDILRGRVLPSICFTQKANDLWQMRTRVSVARNCNLFSNFLRNHLSSSIFLWRMPILADPRRCRNSRRWDLGTRCNSTFYLQCFPLTVWRPRR